MGCPLTNGSRGSCISRGAGSAWVPCLDVVREASVFARVRNNGELEVPEARGDVGEGKEWAGVDDWDASEP